MLEVGLHLPHILPLFDSSETDRPLFYVMSMWMASRFGSGSIASTSCRSMRPSRLPRTSPRRSARRTSTASFTCGTKPAHILLYAGKPVESSSLAREREWRMCKTG